MKNIFRDEIQNNWAEKYYTAGIISRVSTKKSSDIDSRSNKDNTSLRSSLGPRRGILHLCPRAGKIRTSIRIFCKLQRENGVQPKILICYPDKNIQKSWEDDIQEVGYKNPQISYITHISLSKVKEKYDIIVCDEIHLLSENQISNFKRLMDNNPEAHILGLSGTLSKETEMLLQSKLGLKVVLSYTLEEAIRDGIISDYRIKVIKVPLDNVKIIDVKKKRTEKQKFDAISWVIRSKGHSLFLSLARMRIIQNSIAKLDVTRRLLASLSQERVLVFCANNKIANDLGCKVHTANNFDQKEFDKFIKNNSSNNHYAVCKIGNTGVSFKFLDHIIVQAFDSNSENLTQRICRSLILDEPGKVSNIYIISSNEEVELKWLEESLEFFDKSKIQYL